MSIPGYNLQAFNHLISQFEAANPTIKVDQVASVNYTALFQKLQSAVFAGQPTHHRPGL